MTDPAVQAADEQHGGRNSRLGEDRSVVAGARAELDHGEGARLDLRTQCRPGVVRHRPRLELELPDGGDGAFDPGGDLLDANDVLRGGDERIAPDGHRHRPGVPGLALEDALAAGQAGDPGDEPERHSGALEHRALRGAVPGPVRPDPAADRVELVEPCEDARLYRPNGL